MITFRMPTVSITSVAIDIAIKCILPIKSTISSLYKNEYSRLIECSLLSPKLQTLDVQSELERLVLYGCMRGSVCCRSIQW